MTRRIFRSIFAVVAAVLVICLALVIGVLYTHFSSMQEDQLKAECNYVAEGVQNGGSEYLEQLGTDGDRITWIAADGTVLFDSKGNASEMQNHSDREEVEQAVKNGFGQSSRYSTTLTEKTLYYAKLLDDDTVIRVSSSQDTVLALVYGMIQHILIILILSLIISAIIAGRLSKRIIEPLNDIDLDNPLENEVYDELSPLLTLIDRQHRKIDLQVKELERRQNEFLAVVEKMNEGIVLLSKEMRIISMNNAASLFFAAGDADYTGKAFIELERNPEIERSVRDALESGQSEYRLDKEGRVYQINISRIDDGGRIAGAVLLIFDITEKIFAERNRREFTANVSHELKTPLQAIMGSAELMESGIAKLEDIPKFTGKIRDDAARLVTLIDDIIRLSQLDEKRQLPFERIDIYEAVKEEMPMLTEMAAEKNIAVRLRGEPTEISGVPQLLHEIIYNLCDNAIKYNKSGGRVEITVSGDAAGADLRVEDTGIGIASEHTERIFERFYRVDKSRSKETGGTGLGLSIVKHAAEYMNGSVSLESEPGKGTSITVRFEKS